MKKKRAQTFGHLYFDIFARESMKLPGTTRVFQDFETYRMEYRPALTDEQWLWLAQIDAVRVSLQRGPTANATREYEQDRLWVESREYEVGSFEWVCDLFTDLDADAIRMALLAVVPSGSRRYAVRPNIGPGPRPTVDHKARKGKPAAAHCPRAA